MLVKSHCCQFAIKQDPKHQLIAVLFLLVEKLRVWSVEAEHRVHHLPTAIHISVLSTGTSTYALVYIRLRHVCKEYVYASAMTI